MGSRKAYVAWTTANIFFSSRLFKCYFVFSMNDNSQVKHITSNEEIGWRARKMDSIVVSKTHQIMKLNLCPLLSFIDVFVSTFLRAAFRFIEKMKRTKKRSWSKRKMKSRKKIYWNEIETGWIHGWITFISHRRHFFASSSTIHTSHTVVFILFYAFLVLWVFLCLHFPSFLPIVPIFLTFECAMYAYGLSSTPFSAKKMWNIWFISNAIVVLISAQYA